MDFESKYNELVEAARAVVEGNPGLCNMNKRLGRVRDLLPEKVSEDEMIRKSIIHLLQVGGYMSQADKTKAFAWLEKQKEQKPAGTSNIDLDTKVNVWVGYTLNGNAQSYSRKDVQIMLDNCARYFYDYAVMCLDKPAEWSEEDKIMLNNIIWGVHMKSIQPLDEMDDRSKYKKYEDFLKSLPERFNLQSNQEWNEEDEKRFDSCMGRLLTPDGAPTINSSWFEDHCSKHPHWKPSEEQMDALNSIILNGSFTYVGQVQDLISLKDDLKKTNVI